MSLEQKRVLNRPHFLDGARKVIVVPKRFQWRRDEPETVFRLWDINPLTRSHSNFPQFKSEGGIRLDSQIIWFSF